MKCVACKEILNIPKTHHHNPRVRCYACDVVHCIIVIPPIDNANYELEHCYKSFNGRIWIAWYLPNLIPGQPGYSVIGSYDASFSHITLPLLPFDMTYDRVMKLLVLQ